MSGRAKYRRLEELYTEGTEVELMDGEVAWVAVLNPFERQEARKDAQTARARMVLAMKQEGTDEMAQAEAAFIMQGREDAIRKLVGMHEGEIMVRVTDGIRDDPDWKERLDITERQDEILAREPSDPERQLLTTINREYLEEVGKRLQEEQDYLREHYGQMSEDELVAEYRDKYVEQLGSNAALEEFRLSELWMALRVCEGQRTEDGWDHSACGGHRERIYEAKREVRDLPERLFNVYREGFERLVMTEREAKNSDRQRSSSASSPLPSGEAASTASTPSETPDDAPGPSPSLSTTP